MRSIVADSGGQDGKAKVAFPPIKVTCSILLSISSVSDHIPFSRPVQTNTAKGITQRPSMLIAVVFFCSLSYLCILPKQTRMMHPK